MIGYCWRTSAAASRPSLTSCSGVYLFFGGLMTVWAKGLPSARQRNSMRTAARADEVLVAMLPLLQDWLRLAPAEITHGWLVTRARHIVGDKEQSSISLFCLRGPRRDCRGPSRINPGNSRY